MRVKSNVADAVVRDGEMLALIGSQLRLLSVISTSFMEELMSGREHVDQIAAVLEERFGTPEGGSSLSFTEGIARTLASEGLIEILDEL